MVLGYCIPVVLANNYCTAPGCSLTNISKHFTNKKTPCILNIVALYFSMKIVTTGWFCRGSDVSVCVVFLFYRI